jgi:hypothetical protein
VPLALTLPDALAPDVVPDVDPLVVVPPLDAPEVPLALVPVVPLDACCPLVVPLEQARRMLQPNRAAQPKPMESKRFKKSSPRAPRALEGRWCG